MATKMCGSVNTSTMVWTVEVQPVVDGCVSSTETHESEEEEDYNHSELHNQGR